MEKISSNALYSFAIEAAMVLEEEAWATLVELLISRESGSAVDEDVVGILAASPSTLYLASFYANAVLDVDDGDNVGVVYKTLFALHPDVDPTPFTHDPLFHAWRALSAGAGQVADAALDSLVSLVDSITSPNPTLRLHTPYSSILRLPRQLASLPLGPSASQDYDPEVVLRLESLALR